MIARPFDYSSRDFDSLTADLRRRVSTAIPEWTSYESGFESILLEMFAYVGDILNFYIDRQANEFFLNSAVLRESVLNIAQMFGYRPSGQTAAATMLYLTRAAGVVGPITLPAGTQVFSQIEGQEPVIFETTMDAVLGPDDTTIAVEAVEGQTVTETEGLGRLSTGAEHQVHVLFYPRVIDGSVRVFTREGPTDPATGMPTLIEWAYYERLIDASYTDRAFTTYVDADGFTSIIFGDGVSGRIPALNVEILATYRYGRGAHGNVGAGAIKSWVAGTPTTAQFASVTNTTPAQGGADIESIESMRSSIPRSLRALDRAVSLRDHADIALRVNGVAKANAYGTISTSVILYIAPVGGGQPTENLKARVIDFLVPNRVMHGTTVTVLGPAHVPVNIMLDLVVTPQHRRDRVLDSVTAALRQAFSFDSRAFGERITKSLVFQAVANVPGVSYIDITGFNRDGAGFDADFTLAANEIAVIGDIIYGTVTGGIELT